MRSSLARTLFLLALSAAFAVNASAARRLTVAQLEQTLASEIASHRADADIARKIGDTELSERLTASTLDRFAAHLALAPRTALQLQLLADQSAFLDPPAGELPATQPPDAATQEHMLDMARGYVVEKWPRLPNFFATRATNRFDDGPQVLKQGDWPVRAGLHLAGTSTRQITFRDGKEVVDPAASETTSASAAQPQKEVGLHTFGEFGPELTVVLTDTAKGKLTFSHWEQTRAGLAAVFHYEVPRAVSHYTVNYCCTSSQNFIERRDLTFRSRNQSAQQMANLPKAADAQTFRDTPGYHGSLFVDPATGAVLRITLEAELNPGDPIRRASTVVEYGPVKIGDQSYICPLRSIAVSEEPPVYAANGEPRTPATLLVNETSFTKYHRLAATMRVLANGAAPDSAPAAASSTTASAATPNPTAASDANPAAPNSASSAPSSATAANPQPASPSNNAPATESAPAAPLPAPAALAEPPPAPEITLSAASSLPDQPATETDPPDTTVTLKVSSRLVDVGIVVYDKKGHPVSGLKQDDFEVYDNGRKQPIRFFSGFASDGAAPAAVSDNHTFSNRAGDASLTLPSTQDLATTVILIDESHIAWADMSNARQQVLKFLKQVAPSERVGLYAMTSLGFKVLVEVTTDHARLIARLEKWMPSAQSVSQAQDEEMRNRQQFNEVHQVADLNSVNGNHTDVPDADQTVDPQLLTLGDNPGRASLIILGGVARHLSAVPGHKSLVWVSSDNVFADWRDQSVGIDKSSKYVDVWAMHAQEAMNEAHVAVYPFDVSQLEAGTVTADIQHRNVELTQAASDVASLAPGSGSVARDMTPGRLSAEMSQDLHPIQGPIRQVAEATGGRTIRRAGDMAAELADVVAEGHAAYSLSFHPDTNADNQYHTITVKLTGKRGLTARYRTGYLYAKEPATLKERFQQAVWRPMDVNEVAVTAGIGKMSDGANVKINVAATDLGMQERAGRWMDKLDIFFIQRDDAGIHAQVEGQTLGLRLKPSTYQGLISSGVPFEHVVRLKAGTASLRVLVVDENSGRMGSVTIPADALGGGQ